MSGSSRASHTYSRCVVTLDAGISISWAPDPDGSYEHGRLHHEREEAGFRERLLGATAGIEVLFDELEEAGHVFTAPGEPGFREPQRGANGMMEMCEVQLRCVPALDEPALAALAERISTMLTARKPEPVPEQPPTPAARRPWWRIW